MAEAARQIANVGYLKKSLLRHVRTSFFVFTLYFTTHHARRASTVCGKSHVSLYFAETVCYNYIKTVFERSAPMKKIMLAFGTRPEAVKMCPLVLELKKRHVLNTIVCVTGQHRQMLDSALDAFGVKADYDLDIMRGAQTLFDITTGVLNGIRPVLEAESPDLVLVHGDTSTAFAAALACFYLRIPVGHVEAGLRTYDPISPYPEEFNRRAVALTAAYHFAPTQTAKSNLLSEGVDESKIHITGNTVIDAVRETVRADYTHPLLDWASDGKLVIVTAHRRENIGAPMREMLAAVRGIADECADVRIALPVHPNPDVQALAEKALGGHDRIRLVPPLGVCDFHNLLARSSLVLTDSGGVQEEASALGKPVLVMRDITERPEGVLSGGLRLVGTDKNSIVREFLRVAYSDDEYEKMASAPSPYGDGTACRRIADVVEEI